MRIEQAPLSEALLEMEVAVRNTTVPARFRLGFREALVEAVASLSAEAGGTATETSPREAAAAVIDEEARALKRCDEAFDRLRKCGYRDNELAAIRADGVRASRFTFEPEEWASERVISIVKRSGEVAVRKGQPGFSFVVTGYVEIDERRLHDALAAMATQTCKEVSVEPGTGEGIAASAGEHVAQPAAESMAPTDSDATEQASQRKETAQEQRDRALQLAREIYAEQVREARGNGQPHADPNVTHIAKQVARKIGREFGTVKRWFTVDKIRTGVTKATKVGGK
jgi:hypothetical protein